MNCYSNNLKNAVGGVPKQGTGHTTTYVGETHPIVALTNMRPMKSLYCRIAQIQCMTTHGKRAGVCVFCTDSSPTFCTTRPRSSSPPSNLATQTQPSIKVKPSVVRNNGTRGGKWWGSCAMDGKATFELCSSEWRKRRSGDIFSQGAALLGVLLRWARRRECAIASPSLLPIEAGVGRCSGRSSRLSRTMQL